MDASRYRLADLGGVPVLPVSTPLPAVVVPPDPPSSPRPADSAPPTPQGAPTYDIRVILPRADHEADLRHIAAMAARPQARLFWTDEMLLAPLAAFVTIFANPANFVVMLGAGSGDGALAYVRDTKPWRASFYGLAWGRAAMRRPDLWRLSTVAAFRTMRITALDGITAAHNTLACRAMESMGFHWRATLPGALRYAGRSCDAHWYELTATEVLGPSYLAGL